MKKLIKKIPGIGWLVIKMKRLLRPIKYENSEKYWTERYKSGGNSGQGSYDFLAEYKAEILNDFALKNNVKSVIEFGSGDGNQLSYFKFETYKGYEVSPDAIEMCKVRYKNDSSRSFHSYDEYKKEHTDLTLSLDVVYCLTEDAVYNDYMTKLFECSNRFVIIYSSNHNVNDAQLPHMKHRKFTDWIAINREDFEQVDFVKNKYADTVKPFVSDFYIFKRKSVSDNG